MEESELMTFLIQTGFNIERMFEDKAIKEPAYKVLKYRNDLAISILKHALAKTPDEQCNCNKPPVSGQSERLKALLSALIEEFDNGDVSWETRDSAEGFLKSL